MVPRFSTPASPNKCYPQHELGSGNLAFVSAPAFRFPPLQFLHHELIPNELRPKQRAPPAPLLESGRITDELMQSLVTRTHNEKCARAGGEGGYWCIGDGAAGRGPRGRRGSRGRRGTGVLTVCRAAAAAAAGFIPGNILAAHAFPAQPTSPRGASHCHCFDRRRRRRRLAAAAPQTHVAAAGTRLTAAAGAARPPTPAG